MHTLCRNCATARLLDLHWRSDGVACEIFRAWFYTLQKGRQELYTMQQLVLCLQLDHVFFERLALQVQTDTIPINEAI